MEGSQDCQATEGRLADKSNQLILEALHRAASEPGGVPLFATKKLPGLFPGGAGAKPAAEQCQRLGFLQPTHSAAADGAAREAYAITEKGLDFLLRQLSPKQVLEDLARQFDSRQAQLQELAGTVRAWLDETAALRAVVGRVVRDLPAGDGKGLTAAPFDPNGCWQGEALACLKAWPAGHASGDCPLPELFRHVRAKAPRLTVGGFHDGLRRLHEQQQIYLHPWTGPLYEIPEPACALLVGHEIAYYASAR